jgi:catechol 2,3-dioxygenase-like lactoylglutathione lyase family enzyme
MNRAQPGFIGVHLAVRDMAKSLDFYRRVGLHIPDGAETGSHVEIPLEAGRHLAFSTVEITKGYDPG